MSFKLISGEFKNKVYKFNNYMWIPIFDEEENIAFHEGNKVIVVNTDVMFYSVIYDIFNEDYECDDESYHFDNLSDLKASLKSKFNIIF